MEVIIILLLVIILILLVTFRNYAAERFKKIESDLQQFKKTYSSPIPEPPKTVVREVVQPAPKKPEKDYWESSFKRMDEPVILPPKEEKTAEEKINIESAKAEEKVFAPIQERRVITPPPVIESKPTFYERNPDLEKFIGENLVSKIGIAILVLAIGFFVKFAIDKNWIGPVGRVGIGILCGGILVFLAHRLRNSYKAFSSVLAGGGLAVFILLLR